MPQVRLSPPQLLAAAFLVTICLGAILLAMPWAAENDDVDWLTAFFTATSAVCVTGLVVVDTGTFWTPAGQLVILLLIQVGGLGVMSLATFFALLLGKKIELRQRLVMQQALGQPELAGIVSIFRYLLLFSFITEATGALLLALHWFPTLGTTRALWYGIFHAVSAFNNAGFGLFGNFSSLTGFVADPVTNIIIGGLFVLGGLGFVVLHEIFHLPRGRKLSLQSRIVLLATLLLAVLGAALLLATEYDGAFKNLTPTSKVTAAFFQALTPRTAGFNTVDLNALSLPSHLMLMLLMFIGGSPGSTAGGVKTTTFTLLILAVWSTVRGREETVVFRRKIESRQVYRALAIIFSALLLIFLVTVLLALTHRAELLDILFEVFSALGTVGLSLGLTTELNVTGRLLIMLTMFLGRLGPLTIGYALAYQKVHPDLHYPEGKIMVG